MNRTGTVDIRQLAGHAYRRGRQESAALGFVISHPREVRRLPVWLRQRRAATMALRVPWWPYDAVSWIAANLPQSARVFEYGGGGSTLWLESHGATVTTAEHDEDWLNQMSAHLGPGTTLLFQPPAASGAIPSVAAPGYFDTYVAAIDSQPDNHLDLVIVDGRARVECVYRAMPKVKPGGLMLLDDTDRVRYQPAIQSLAGWERHVFRGLKPGQFVPAETSAWRRPN
jgi:hypothetical protein